MTKATYRKLKLVWVLGSAFLVGAVVAGWMKAISFGVVFAAVVVFGGGAAVSGWVLRDQKFEELPE